MPDPAKIGKFTAGVARRTQVGQPSLTESVKEATDEWTVYLPNSGATPGHPLKDTVTGVPELGSKWDIDDEWVCDKVTWANSFPNEYWVASVHYVGPDDEETDETETLPDGVVLKKITYQPTAWNMDCEYDEGTGVPVLNMAGDRFQDALTKQTFTTSIVIETKEDKVPISDLALQGSINKTAEKIGGVNIAKHCGLLTISIKQGDDPDYPFEVVRNIQVATNPLPKEPTPAPSNNDSQSAQAPRDDPSTGNWIVTEFGQKVAVTSYGRDDLGFDACVLNAGYRYFNEDGDEKLRFMDEKPDGSKAEAVDPHLLDEYGKEAADGNTYWIVIQRYPEQSWPQWYPKGAPKKKDTQPEQQNNNNNQQGGN